MKFKHLLINVVLQITVGTNGFLFLLKKLMIFISETPLQRFSTHLILIIMAELKGPILFTGSIGGEILDI
jgi:hypothetical protein